jgi:hypothetical protein
MRTITPVYADDSKMVFKCEDLFYPDYKGQFFVLEMSKGYGFFTEITLPYTKGELLDEFKIELL